MMTINIIRSIMTVILFLAFIGLCFWAYSPKRKKAFIEASMLPFAEENSPLGERPND